MSLDWNTSQVDRSKWPDGGLPLFDFCTMMMLCGVGSLKTDEDLTRLKKRALVMESIMDFGWKHHNKTETQHDMIDLIPLMKGLRINVSNESITWFVKRLKEKGLS